MLFRQLKIVHEIQQLKFILK